MDIDSMILETLAERIGQKSFERWFDGKVHFALMDKTLYVSTDSVFRSDWIRDTSRHVIAKVCLDLFGIAYPIKFITGPFPQRVKKESEVTNRVSTVREASVMVSAVSSGSISSISVPPDNDGDDLQKMSINLFNPEEDENEEDFLSTRRTNTEKRLNVFDSLPAQKDFAQEDLSARQVDLSRFPRSTFNDTGTEIDMPVVQPAEQRKPIGSGRQSKSKTETAKSKPETARAKTETAKRQEDDSSLFEVVENGSYNTVRMKKPSRTVSTPTGNTRNFATFDDFVMGPSNRLARNMVELAVQDPGQINPVYINGPTSVGKTHLLEAAWSASRSRANRNLPLYMTAEQFVTGFVQSWNRDRNAAKTADSFRNRFKNISLFILDDLHFLQGKNATQTELICLLDQLRNRKVQMIFSGDRPLSEMGQMRSELISRLSAGIECRVESPERDTLLKIFRQMAATRRLVISEDVCRFVVSRFTTHARQLSGVLNRLHAASIANNVPITLDLANESLGDLMQSNRRTLRLEDIENAVLEVFGLTDSSLRSKSRARLTAWPRMLAMYLARKYTRSALSEIGRYFGNRSHSTVISAQKRIELLLTQNTLDPAEGMTVPLSETLNRIERFLHL